MECNFYDFSHPTFHYFTDNGFFPPHRFWYPRNIFSLSQLVWFSYFSLHLLSSSNLRPCCSIDLVHSHTFLHPLIWAVARRYVLSIFFFLSSPYFLCYYRINCTLMYSLIQGNCFFFSSVQQNFPLSFSVRSR